jgi:D-lyxose ketol-isomerase
MRITKPEEHMKATKARAARKRALEILSKAKIAITPKEAEGIEVADFGLGDLAHIGLELIVYENNSRYCAKEIVLFPGQTCPEHRHPPLSNANPGKQETFRCRWGEFYLYIPGTPSGKPRGRIPRKYAPYFTVWNEIVLRPGDQYTLPPNTPHWFQGGKKGAVVSEFSSNSSDETDLFTDPHIQRVPAYE